MKMPKKVMVEVKRAKTNQKRKNWEAEPVAMPAMEKQMEHKMRDDMAR